MEEIHTVTPEPDTARTADQDHFGTLKGVAEDTRHYLEAAMDRMGLGSLIQVSEAIEAHCVQAVCDLLGWECERKNPQ